MQTQRDFESHPILAIFESQSEAEDAVTRLRSDGIEVAGVEETPLAPGRYQAEDHSVDEHSGGIWVGGLIGIPIGAVLGVLLAFLATSPGPWQIFWFAVTGAALSALMGAFVGTMVRERFDDNVAEGVEIPVDAGARLVVVHVHGPGPAPRVRASLERAGARGFLDANTPAAEEAMTRYNHRAA